MSATNFKKGDVIAWPRIAHGLDRDRGVVVVDDGYSLFIEVMAEDGTWTGAINREQVIGLVCEPNVTLKEVL